MKRKGRVGIFLVAVLFLTAVGLCIRELQQTQTVSAFVEGGMRIVLDAGHGGIDGGVTGKQTGAKESDVNLAIVLALQDVLIEQGFDVILTRKTDAGLYDTTAKGFKKRDMQKRKEIIQRASPTMVVSIHQNYYPSATSRGGQVFYRADDDKSLQLSEILQNRLNTLYAAQNVRARKPTTGDYYMLRCADCPSVLLECGFLSNEKDERLLIDAEWQKTLAEQIAEGITEYFWANAA